LPRVGCGIVVAHSSRAPEPETRPPRERSAPLAAGDWLAVAVAVVWPVALLEALKGP
jgi:hypothetical protein